MLVLSLFFGFIFSDILVISNNHFCDHILTSEHFRGQYNDKCIRPNSEVILLVKPESSSKELTILFDISEKFITLKQGQFLSQYQTISIINNAEGDLLSIMFDSVNNFQIHNLILDKVSFQISPHLEVFSIVNSLWIENYSSIVSPGKIFFLPHELKGSFGSIHNFFPQLKVASNIVFTDIPNQFHAESNRLIIVKKNNQEMQIHVEEKFQPKIKIVSTIDKNVEISLTSSSPSLLFPASFSFSITGPKINSKKIANFLIHVNTGISGSISAKGLQNCRLLETQDSVQPLNIKRTFLPQLSDQGDTLEVFSLWIFK